MIDASVGLFLRALPEHLMKGVISGEYQIFGSVIRDAASGQIRGFLQEAAPLANLLLNTQMMPISAVGSIANVGLSAAQLVQGRVIQAGVARIEDGIAALQSLGIADLALGIAGIGISVTGFAVMAAKIDGVKKAVLGLSDKIETVSVKIDHLQREAIDVDFAELKALSKSFDEAWQLAGDASERRWHDVAIGALSNQSRFELRADRVLGGGPAHYQIAEPFLDAISLASALRVAALAACNESIAASQAAADGGRSIERLTGGIGIADLSRITLANDDVQPGTQSWTLAQAQANQAARIVTRRIRQREAAAFTRAAPLATLEHHSIHPRDWLGAARKEAEAPILFMLAA